MVEATLEAAVELNRAELVDLVIATHRIAHQQVTEYLPTVIKGME